jgi:hypothetical protein
MKKQFVLNVVEFIAMGTLQLFSIAVGLLAFGSIVYAAFLAFTETY